MSVVGWSSNAMSAIRGVLIDLSGTLHVGDTACEGAVEGLKRLHQAKIPVRFCTNTTKESANKLVNRLRHLGFQINREEVFTSLSACRSLIQARNLRPLMFLEDAALEDFDGIPYSNEPHNAVVVGLSPSMFRYDMLNKAFRILKNDRDASLIAIHKAKYFEEKDGLSLGPGPFVEALECAADVRAHIVGKPERGFYEFALRDMGMLPNAKNVAMVGDDIAVDLGGGAKELGLIRFLVKTGKYRPGDEMRDTSIDGVYENFGVAVDAILGRID